MFVGSIHDFGKSDARFSEKMLISTKFINGFMSNLIKKSWMDSILDATIPIVSLGAIFARKLKRKVYERKMEFYLKLKRT